jgi:hypothetical protein
VVIKQTLGRTPHTVVELFTSDDGETVWMKSPKKMLKAKVSSRFDNVQVTDIIGFLDILK